MTLNNQGKIVDLLQRKSVLKQDIYNTTRSAFDALRMDVKKLCEDLKNRAEAIDSRIRIEFHDRSTYHFEAIIAGDLLVFHMHSNVFRIDESNPMWKSGYLTENENRGYCGIIQVYNFLSDSFKLNRDQDLGYLIARVLVNFENHFFVQGKSNLGTAFTDFLNEEFNDTAREEFLGELICHALNFDLLVPPYKNMQEVTVAQVRELSMNLRIQTGKRLGFQFMDSREDTPQ